MTLSDLVLAGVGRATEPLTTETPIDDVVSRLPAGEDASDPARRLLLTAGALTLYRRAGRLGRANVALSVAAPLDPRPACSPAIEDLLRQMIDDGHRDLLPEACAQLAAAGLRLSPGLLVSCLDLREAPHRRAVKPVLGTRGRWLAARQSSWAWAADPVGSQQSTDVSTDTVASTETANANAGADPTANANANVSASAAFEALQLRFDEGKRDARAEALTSMRALDPTRARERLAASWASETFVDKAVLLPALATGLGPADEPWLESVLGDRAADARRLIASLLARIPGSAFAQRAAARADACLTWDAPSSSTWNRMKAALGASAAPGTLHVVAPSAAGSDWERDAIPLKAAKEWGERAHWLLHLLAVVPPSHWTTRFDATADQLVDAASRADWRGALLAGWTRATALHAASDWAARDWAAPLWIAWLTLDISRDPHLHAVRRDAFVDLLPLLVAQDELLAASLLLDATEMGAGITFSALVALLPPTWSAPISDAILQRIERWLAGPQATAAPDAHTFLHLLSFAARHAAPSRMETVLRLLDQARAQALPSIGARALDHMLAQLTLRQRLFEEIAR